MDRSPRQRHQHSQSRRSPERRDCRDCHLGDRSPHYIPGTSQGDPFTRRIHNYPILRALEKPLIFNMYDGIRDKCRVLLMLLIVTYSVCFSCCLHYKRGSRNFSPWGFGVFGSEGTNWFGKMSLSQFDIRLGWLRICRLLGKRRRRHYPLIITCRGLLFPSFGASLRCCFV